jgi:GcrA cell cycle regulator
MRENLWTKAADAKLCRHFAEGLSASKIGEAMGLTKNQCIGRLYRLGLKRPEKQPAHLRPKAQRKPAGVARGRQPKATLPMPAELAPAPPAIKVKRGRPAENRHTPAPHPSTRAPRPSDSIWRPRTCQFPEGDPREPDFHFCDAPITPDGRPYCDEHEARCYTKWVPKQLRDAGEAA